MYLSSIDIICLVATYLHFISATESARFIATFHSPYHIGNVKIDDNKIFIGAKNHLYKLRSDNLTLIQDVATGPVLDSPYCNADFSSCISEKAKSSVTNTDNWNKVLEVVPTGLLSCGSVRQGICEIRSLNDISIIIKNSTVPLAANSQNASTVSLVDIKNDKIFVAATFSSESPYREGFPAVATRDLNDFLPINAGSLDGEAAIHVRAEYRSRFHIDYIDAFYDEHYVYWATVQKEYISSTAYSKKVSKLVRVCQNDDKYISYSEIEIQCRSAENMDYNIITSLAYVKEKIIGVFVNERHPADSAICILSMQKVRITFWYNIDRCRSGTDTIGMPHIGRDSKCVNKSHLPLSEDTCQLGVGGTIEASQLANIEFKEKTLTSIAVRVINRTMHVITGTQTGEIIQMSFSNKSFSTIKPYSQYIIDSTPVSKIIFKNNDFFYALTNNELKKIYVSMCSQYTTCSSCVSSFDPACGWCIFEDKCSSQSECKYSFLSKNSCPHINGKLLPQSLSINNQPVTVFIPTTSLPAPSGPLQYQCFFDESKSLGHYSSTGISCPVPAQLPKIAFGTDHIVVPLAIRSSLTSANIISHNITFYNCSSNQICSSCSLSPWPCKWCEDKVSSCISSNEFCENPIVAAACPRIKSAVEPTILVANGLNVSLSFPVVNIPSGDGNSLICRFRTTLQQNLTFDVIGNNYVENITCSATQFSYTDPVATQNYSLELIKHNEVIDKTLITVYKCEQMAADCSTCFALDPKWRCTWCESKCRFENYCNSKLFYPKKADRLCTEPIITSFSPMMGPTDGGTKIEIYGRDLGSRIQDIDNRIMVAGSKCRVINYEVSVKITCVVDNGTGFGPIRISIGKSGKRFVESSDNYIFEEIQPRIIYPSFGPISGGTKVTISGKNVHIGSNVSVHMDNLPCNVLLNQRSLNELVCITSPSRRVYDVSAIRIQIDNSISILNSRFSYRPDPTVYSIYPTISFSTGGRSIYVKGKYFDSIIAAKMFILSDSNASAKAISTLSDCKIYNSTSMSCKSPSISPIPQSNQNATVSNHWPIGFIMDDVREVRNLAHRIRMTYVPDPQFIPFDAVKIQSFDQPLVIQGNDLAQAATLDEYNITVGTVPCNIFMLDDHQIMCHLPSTAEILVTDHASNNALISIYIGMLQVRIGFLNFQSNDSNLLQMNTKRFMLIMCSGFAILLFSAVLITALWRRRLNKREQDYLRIQLQMEQMESSVRNECKQAFAELQTEMTDLTTAIDDAGIPYNAKSEFIGRLLNRNAMDPAFDDVWLNHIFLGHVATQELDSFLWNRQFLGIFIYKVDSENAISCSEKAVLASLLIAVLSRNMTYCTDLVLALLSDHIERIARLKKTDMLHLIFRQSDSVVEKMVQYWLTITLYPYICNPCGPGKQFYLLYKALKCQIEKGPVDAVTGFARYSLSENGLLRESVDARAINVTIIPVQCIDPTPVSCRVLLCDTISQVKAKFLDCFYKNYPYSQRISSEQFDLIWNTSTHGLILLKDDDQPQCKGVKQLNTVAYYKIPNNARLSMQMHNQNSCTVRSGSSDTTCSACSSTQLIEPNISLANKNHVHYKHLSDPTNGLCQSFISITSTKKLSKEIDQPRNIPEIHLTRLLTCKGTIHSFVNDFFDSVMFARSDTPVPVILKYFLDFLDREAARNNINDSEVIYSWKTNAVILRFWMQFIQNPDCWFDIERENYLDISLKVIGQTLIDAFSRSESTLSKESPSSKLLFAKDLPHYRSLSIKMFERIQTENSIDDKIFYEHIDEISNMFIENSIGSCAINRLLHWVTTNGLKLVEALTNDHFAVQHGLADRLEQIIRYRTTPEHEHIYATLQ